MLKVYMSLESPMKFIGLINALIQSPLNTETVIRVVLDLFPKAGKIFGRVLLCPLSFAIP